MENLVYILGLSVVLGGMILFGLIRERKTGRNEQKLKSAEEAIKNVKKANSAASDSSFDDELRDKYDK